MLLVLRPKIELLYGYGIRVIPCPAIDRLVPQLIAKGRIATAGIGVTLIAQRYNAQLDIDGVGIAEVLPDGPAHRGSRGARHVVPAPRCPVR